MDRNLETNDLRNFAGAAVKLRLFQRQNRLLPQDYQRDAQVVVFDTCPREAKERFERFKTERAAGLR